jgi:hypothetical protein
MKRRDEDDVTGERRPSNACCRFRIPRFVLRGSTEKLQSSSGI